MASEAVRKYLVDTNRPYSANDIMMNLHKKYGKTEVTRALDTLAASSRIKEKIYGKQKVYCALQEDSSDKEEVQIELTALEQRCNEVSERLRERQEQVKTVETELRALQSSMTDEEAVEELERVQKAVQALKTKLHNLQENTVQIPPELRSKTLADHSAAVAIYRKRKRMCNDILDAILDSYPHTRARLCEEAGIETDESVGCVIRGT